MSTGKSFASTVRGSYSSSFRPSYIPNVGYGRSNFHAPPLPSNGDTLFLPKKCGFLLPFDNDLTMEQYLTAVGDIIGDSNMVFAGKTNNMIKIYLKSESLVNKLYEQHPQLIINKKVLTVRKLYNEGFRILLSNTEPGMPNSILLEELSKFTKVISEISFVKLGARNERFAHLIGYKRTLYVESIDDLPLSFSVTYEKINYKIFVVIDRIRCFNCREEGHLVKNCPVPLVSTDNSDSVDLNKRLEKAKESPPNDSPSSFKNEDLINAILPSFAADSGSPPALSNEVNPPLPPTCNSTPLSGSSESTSVKPQASVSVDVIGQGTAQGVSSGSGGEYSKALTSTETEDTSMTVDTDSQTDRCKKRTLTPPPQEDEKKVRVEKHESDLDSLVPLLKIYTPGVVPPLVYIDLIRDLKSANKQKKLSLLEDYSVDANDFISLLNKLASEKSLSKTVKNRLKNLRKTLKDILTPNGAGDVVDAEMSDSNSIDL